VEIERNRLDMERALEKAKNLNSAIESNKEIQKKAESRQDIAEN
jgi:hypothetical protein